LLAKDVVVMMGGSLGLRVKKGKSLVYKEISDLEKGGKEIKLDIVEKKD